MKNYQKYILGFLTGFFLMTCCTRAAHADVFELEEVSIDFRSYFPGGVDPILVQDGASYHSLDKKLDLHVNTSVFNSFYWNNMVNSTTDTNDHGSGQFRVVGWEFQLGVHLLPFLEGGYYHHSQHVLDSVGSNHYPVEDGIELKLFLYRRFGKSSLISF